MMRPSALMLSQGSVLGNIALGTVFLDKLFRANVRNKQECTPRPVENSLPRIKQTLPRPAEFEKPTQQS